MYLFFWCAKKYNAAVANLNAYIARKAIGLIKALAS
jgi:hypothetical protein